MSNFSCLQKTLRCTKLTVLVFYFQIQMISKQELKEEKALSDLYQYCLLRQSLWFITSFLLKKINKPPIVYMIKAYNLLKLFTLKFFLRFKAPKTSIQQSFTNFTILITQLPNIRHREDNFNDLQEISKEVTVLKKLNSHIWH